MIVRFIYKETMHNDIQSWANLGITIGSHVRITMDNGIVYRCVISDVTIDASSVAFDFEPLENEATPPVTARIKSVEWN